MLNLGFLNDFVCSSIAPSTILNQDIWISRDGEKLHYKRKKKKLF